MAFYAFAIGRFEFGRQIRKWYIRVGNIYIYICDIVVNIDQFFYDREFFHFMNCQKTKQISKGSFEKSRAKKIYTEKFAIFELPRKLNEMDWSATSHISMYFQQD